MGKHYFTPVVDFGWLEDGSVVLFELGGGICGSGFPDYDYSHEQSIRHLMLKNLAKRVKNVFLISVAENILREELTNDFLKSLSNVICFNNVTTFVAYLRANPTAAEDGVIVIDRLSKGLTLMEDDYARLLESNGIRIPVINADSYKFYDNKVFFPLLFQEGQRSFIPRTFIVNKHNTASCLSDIAKSNIKYFVLKPAMSSQARGTLIAEGHQLAEIIALIMHKDKAGIDRLTLSGINKKNLSELIECIVDDNCTFIIRELVMPKPVQLKDGIYRCAGRSVFIACYDDETNKVELDHMASYWQAAAKPLGDKEIVSHETLISTDHIHFTTMHTTQNFFRMANSELEEYKRAYRNPTDLNTDQLAQILPHLEKILGHLINQVARQKPHQCILDIHHQSPNNAVLEAYIYHRLHHMQISVTEPLLHVLKSRMKTYHSFIVMQIIFDLYIFKHLPNEQTLQRCLYTELNKFSHQSIREAAKDLEQFASAFLALPGEAREAYKSYMLKVDCRILLNLIGTCEKIMVREEGVIKEMHKRAYHAFQASNFPVAHAEWQDMFKILKKCNPNSQKMVNCYSNLVSCLIAIKKYDDAIKLCSEGITLCEQLNIPANNLQSQLNQCLKFVEPEESAAADVSGLRL